MPVYNEARTLRRIVAAVLASPVELEIELVCVDDCSTDRSPQILRELAAKDARIKVITQPRNEGKGAAIRTAIQCMTGDIAIVQDADLEYDPAEFPLVLAPILAGKADAVFGSRFAASPQRKVLLYWHSVANRLLTWLTNILNDINITDMETCYKAVRADILKRIPLRSNRFGIEPELTTRLAQWNLRIYEVPISYHGRSAAEGKKIGWKDAISAAWCLFKYRYIDRRFTTHDGYYILQSVRRARGFNKWMLSQFRQYVGSRVYEAGCGIGNFTELLLDRERLVCVDCDPFYTEVINRRFGHMENVRALHLDLTSGAATETVRSRPTDNGELSSAEPGGSRETFDTIISLNVIEHIQDDRRAITHFFDLLEPGGHAAVLIPAHPRLFTVCDTALGHFRRYTATELRDKFTRAGFDVVSVREFNRLGVFGWWLNGKLGRRDLSPVQMRTYELLLPLAKLLDWIGIGPGLSLIIVARKPAEAKVPEIVVRTVAAASPAIAP
jgi:glycosyltransferase involved in cell wall biosynthesis